LFACGGGGGASNTKTETPEPNSGKVSDGANESSGAVVEQALRSVSGVVVDEGQPVRGAVVAIGRKVYGDSSSLNGPPALVEGLVIHKTTTDENGAFRFDEVPSGELALVAEAPDLGRSVGTVVPKGSGSLDDLSLELVLYGSLSGAVMYKGQPQAGIIVQTQTRAAPGVIFAVQSDNTGMYRFDKLAPGDYRIVAVAGEPATGMHYYSATADVTPESHSTADIPITPGTDVLFVPLKPRGGAKAQVSFVYLLEGEYQIKDTLELNVVLADLGDRFSAWSISLEGKPAVVSGLMPGNYTTCVIPFPAELATIDEILDYREREGDNMLAFCAPVVLDGSTQELSVSVDITVPTFVRAPNAAE
jgi:hypothetical protein